MNLQIYILYNMLYNTLGESFVHFMCVWHRDGPIPGIADLIELRALIGLNCIHLCLDGTHCCECVCVCVYVCISI